MRKSLDRKWSTPGEISLGDSLVSPETPSKSLLEDKSIVFSPPSIVKEAAMLPKDEPDDKLTSLPSRMSGIKLFSSSPSAKKKVKSKVGLLEEALMAVCIVMCDAYPFFRSRSRKYVNL